MTAYARSSRKFFRTLCSLPVVLVLGLPVALAAQTSVPPAPAPSAAPSSPIPAPTAPVPAADPSPAPATAAPAAEPPSVAPSSTAPPTSVSAPPPTPGGETGLKQRQEQPAVDDFTIRVTSREVNLTFTVTDSQGRFVTGLQPQSFGLLDDGRPPESVVFFRSLSSLPLRVGIMMDTSSSIRQRFTFEQDAAVEFLLQVLHRNDRAFVEGFDVNVDVTQDFTNNIDLLGTGIHKLRPGGGTSLYDSLYKTCRDQMLGLKEQNATRKAIILVSDGEDNYSHALETDAIKMCERAETIVYAISTDVGPTPGKGGDSLKRIAEATGGRAFFPQRIEDVSVGFRNIEQELRSQYSLGYRPANFKADGSFRTIYLTSTNRNYKVSARKGYFAPKN